MDEDKQRHYRTERNINIETKQLEPDLLPALKGGAFACGKMMRFELKPSLLLHSLTQNARVITRLR